MRGWTGAALLVFAALAACGPSVTATDSETGSEATSEDNTSSATSDAQTETESETSTTDTGDLPMDGCEPEDILRGFITVTTVEELEALSGICGVDGTLTIRDSAQITTLEPLAALEWVTGQLVVSELPALESLAGLASLRETTGLYLRGLGGIDDLSGLDAFEKSAALSLRNLPTVAGLPESVTIGHTFTPQATLRFSVGSIADLEGLEQLPEVELMPGAAPFDTMIVDIESLPGLFDLVGVETVLTEDPSAVRLWLRNLPIADLSGLEGQTVLGGLALRQMPELASVAGGDELVEIGELIVSGATALPDFANFAGLEQVGLLELGNYCINESGGSDDNPLLVDLSGFGGLVGVEVLTVSGLSAFDSFAGLAPQAQIGEAQIRWNLSLAPATIDAFLLDYGLVIGNPGIDDCGNLGQDMCPPCPGD